MRTRDHAGQSELEKTTFERQFRENEEKSNSLAMAKYATGLISTLKTVRDLILTQ